MNGHDGIWHSCPIYRFTVVVAIIANRDRLGYNSEYNSSGSSAVTSGCRCQLFWARFSRSFGRCCCFNLSWDAD